MRSTACWPGCRVAEIAGEPAPHGPAGKRQDDGGRGGRGVAAEDAATGFFTREVRERAVRRGFTIQTLDGRTAVLADIGGEGPRIGRYRVRLHELETLGVPALLPRSGVRLIVVDEIGKMECLSRLFCDTVRQALDSPTPLLGTVARHGGGFIAEVRRRADVTIVEVTAQNRDQLPGTILARLGLDGARPDAERD